MRYMTIADAEVPMCERLAAAATSFTEDNALFLPQLVHFDDGGDNISMPKQQASLYDNP